MTTNSTRFNQTLHLIDQANSQDPNKEIYQGKEHPKELLYAQRMTEWLSKCAPDASESLKLAARSQHICRWTIPRESYPMDRKGYLLWRTELKKFHADKAARIMEQCEYDGDTIDRVRSLIQKQRLKTDPESQTLEDVVCLVFLEYYLEDFAAKHEKGKVVSILEKTLRKMSDKGLEAALKLSFNDHDSVLVKLAVERLG